MGADAVIATGVYRQVGVPPREETTEWVSQKNIRTRLYLEVPESQGRVVGP